MINFSGQTRKRTVNLGDRKGFRSDNNFLQQSIQQRKEREEQRRKEKAAIVIQRKIVEYLNTSKQAWGKLIEWKESATLLQRRTESLDVFDSYQSTELIKPINEWLDEGIRLVRWFSKKAFNPMALSELLLTLQSSKQLVELSGLSNSFNQSTLNLNLTMGGRIQNLIAVLSPILCNKRSSRELELTTFNVIVNIQANEIVYSDVQLTSLISWLGSYQEKGENKIALPEKVVEQAMDMVYRIGLGGTGRNFEHKNSVSLLLALSLAYNQPNLNYLHTLRENAKYCNADMFHKLQNSIPNEKLPFMLINYLIIHGDEEFVVQDYIIISLLLRYFNGAVCDDNEIFGVGEDDDLEKPNEKHSAVIVNKKQLEVLRILYTRNFLQGVFHFFKFNDKRDKEHNLQKMQTQTQTQEHTQENDSEYDTSFLTEDRLVQDMSICILSRLVTLRPQWKSLVFNQICATNSVHLIHCQLRKNSSFNQIEQDSSSELIPREKLQQSFATAELWEGIALYHEVISYWLLISLDHEIFREVDTKQLLSVAQFTKRVVLTLLYNEDLQSEAVNLKNVCLRLLNQLYVKNLRVNFLPDDFWTLKQIHIDVDKINMHILADSLSKTLYDDEDDIDEENLTWRKKPENNPSSVYAALEILKHAPYFIAFRDRVKIFQELIEHDREMNFSASRFDQEGLAGNIRREHVLEDAFAAFASTGSQFKQRIRVHYVNQHGPEAGIDGGGITKELLTGVTTEGFDPENGLFQESSDHRIYPTTDLGNTSSQIFITGTGTGTEVGSGSGSRSGSGSGSGSESDFELMKLKLDYLRFMGMCVGKCMYEGILIDASFAPFFLNKWCHDSFKNTVDDLKYMDVELYNNTIKLLDMSSTELDALDLTFFINERISGNTKIVQYDLLPNGSKIKVDRSNVHLYNHKFADFKLNKSLAQQTKHFLSGVQSIIPLRWLTLFDYHELQMLISGGEKAIDVDDWRRNAVTNGFEFDDTTLNIFWEVVAEMSSEERRKLLAFVTSSPRPPLLGFDQLNPKFGIQNKGAELNVLPSAATCVNLLKLPDYRDKNVLKEKLLYAINSAAGFDLS
ncbi:ubiquitin-protein ligase (E3) [Lodderomyces elongisporus]|uniref:ubiquitin-protein ligase (E3) n=1 Tax=Lodderomyces elongisporus TaxID=36914 RepID=UPI00291D09A1|nr:ubiquitin-protein ligase (E3) [Lodderomyces elongisporus]WLF81459.1 ubiquitin-protein ligase (E3) [Lodderomyces elongisporus]